VSYCISPLDDACRGKGLRALIPDDYELGRAYAAFGGAVAAGWVRPADPAWQAIAERTKGTERDALWLGQPWLVRVPDRLVRIDPAGRCYTSVHLKTLIGDDVYIGRVPDDSLLELWRAAPLLNRLRELGTPSRYFGAVVDLRELDAGTLRRR
jgi:hypothetical protein